MKDFRKVWNDDTNGFLLKNKDMVFNHKAFYEAFMKEFPASRVTYCAFKNQCSRLGVVSRKNPHGACKCRPLYSEQVKKGYVRIKIAQPNVWISKAKWVYMETHPWEDCSEPSEYIFLDGNTRNFHPDNIERVLKCLQTIFYQFGGKADMPEVTRFRITQAKLKKALLDKGEQIGLVCRSGNTRTFIEDRNARQRERMNRLLKDDNYREKFNQQRREYKQRIKESDPERYQKLLERNREAGKRYQKRKRRMKNEKK